LFRGGRKMILDPEIEAMNEICTALKNLDDDAKERVIRWVIDKFSFDLIKHEVDSSLKIKAKGFSQNLEIKSFKSVADIFTKACPKNDIEKVLIVSAYLQETKLGSELTGREINARLNLLGHGVRNITSTIGALINRKPQLMIQTRKEGKTKQAQKKYKVTSEGLASAKEMLKV
jgi:hypothetical protein